MSRLQRSFPGALVLAAGCTLTNEPFEPSLVESIRTESIRGPSEPPEATAGGAPSPVESAAPGSEGGELPPAPALAPVEASGDGLAGASPAGVSEEAAGDAGAALGDAGAPAPCLGEALGGSCYELFREALAWEAAEQRCIDWGGHLASVGSATEDDFLAGWLVALAEGGPSQPGTWLGGTDAEEDGDFRWSDGAPLTYEAWGPAQPDNGAGLDCIEKRGDEGARWHDRRCGDERQYVCERPR